MDRLDTYRRMRDFAATPEPDGSPPTRSPASDPDRPRFVIQQHDATRLHWDLRLERDGVLVSFACPRGLPWRPKDNRLAVHTEDHPLEYLEFHGSIPAGEYGGGDMVIWDRGTYEVHEFTDRKVTVSLHGERVEGRYALFPIKGDRDWMIHRMDPPQDPDRRPLPDDLRPMTAAATGLPDEPDGWAFEIRWTGIRALLANEAGTVTLTGTDGTDLSRWFPEVRRIGRALAAIEVVLDTVLVPVDRDGRPHTDRAPLDRRLTEDSDSRIRRMAEDRPAAAMAFDLLWLEGHPTSDLTYDERRTLLDELGLHGPAWQTPRNHLGDAHRLLEVARAQGLSGLVAKRRAASYAPGASSDDWRDVPA
jgi:bifunctional non-homologous end joining protein LigD